MGKIRKKNLLKMKTFHTVEILNHESFQFHQSWRWKYPHHSSKTTTPVLFFVIFQCQVYNMYLIVSPLFAFVMLKVIIYVHGAYTVFMLWHIASWNCLEICLCRGPCLWHLQLTYFKSGQIMPSPVCVFPVSTQIAIMYLHSIYANEQNGNTE